MAQSNLIFINLGVCDYTTTLKKQKEVWQKRVNDEINDTLILVEHPPVLTIGKHGKQENLLISQSILKEKNIPLYKITRGGDITFHGPGQLVGYPIFKIDNVVGIRKFVYIVEQILCDVLDTFKIIAATRHPLIGVWVDNEKIASIGITVEKKITYHGFALNISTDLSYFDLINPCGLKNIKMTSMEKVLQKKLSIELVKERIQIEFINQFS